MNLPSQTKLVIKFWFPFTIRWHVFHHPCYKPRTSSKIRHNFSKLKRGEGNFQRELFVDWLQKGEFLVDLCIYLGGVNPFWPFTHRPFFGGKGFCSPRQYLLSYWETTTGFVEGRQAATTRHGLHQLFLAPQARSASVSQCEVKLLTTFICDGEDSLWDSCVAATRMKSWFSDWHHKTKYI